MKMSAFGHHYQVRFKDLQGEVHEARVYALDAKNPQDLVIESNEEPRKRAYLITIILKLERKYLMFS